MRSRQASWTTFELVPLADRLRYMRLVRLALVAVVVVVAGVNPGGVAPAASRLWPATAIYVAISGIGEVLWRLSRRRGLFLFGSLLVVDATYLVYASYLTGGMQSPLRYTVLLHLIAVALLASYRTGLKLVIWYVLLFLVEYYLPSSTPHANLVKGYAGVVVFAGVAAAIAFGTSSLSAVNERELRRRRYDLEALAKLAVDLEQASDPIGVAETTLGSIVDAFGIERMALIQLRPGPELLAGRGLCETADRPSRLDPRSAMAQAAQHRATLLPIELSEEHDPWLNQLFGTARNLVVTPLFAEGGCLGVFVFEHGTKRGSRIERRLLTIIERFAAHAALALRNAMLLESLREDAASDPLTGIANRRSFEQTLEREVARSTRTGEPFTLVMLDLDHFKRVNDTHGHQAGDTLLRHVAAALLAHCREMDVASRYGGEEFAVILPNCGPEEAAESATRLWSAASLVQGDIPVTASAGFAVFPDNAANGHELVLAADRALYEAKTSGRNRILGSTEGERHPRLGLVRGTG